MTKESRSFEDLVRANVFVWLASTSVAGAVAGVGFIELLDERFQNELLKAKASAPAISAHAETLRAQLHSSQQRIAQLEAENRELQGSLSGLSCARQDAVVASLNRQLASSEGSGKTDASAAQGARVLGGTDLPELRKVNLRVWYKSRRVADANRIAQFLTSHFASVVVSQCGANCYGPAVRYPKQMSPSIPFAVAKLLADNNIADFAEPEVSADNDVGADFVWIHLY